MGFISGEEEVAVILAPVAVYWLYSGIYEALGSVRALDSYRLHTRKDEEKKNMVSKKDVVKGVLLQQAIQVAVSLAMLKLRSEQDGVAVDAKGAQLSTPSSSSSSSLLSTPSSSSSGHHRVVAPYAFAAQYNHPVDGVLTETLSGAAAYLASGLPPRAAAAFFVFAAVKGIDDHCGLLLPWNPLHAAFENSAAYHDVHHRLGGGRRNLSQPFFVHWDRLLGTHAGYTVREKNSGGDGGGLEAKAVRKDRDA
uniref:aldehyde oxygenase (deformylating) n=1 Tax=Leersia perrieri TaxID=77586 RepID=A0A0D9V3Q4_9ORYZ